MTATRGDKLNAPKNISNKYYVPSCCHFYLYFYFYFTKLLIHLLSNCFQLYDIKIVFRSRQNLMSYESLLIIITRYYHFYYYVFPLTSFVLIIVNAIMVGVQLWPFTDRKKAIVRRLVSSPLLRSTLSCSGKLPILLDMLHSKCERTTVSKYACDVMCYGVKLKSLFCTLLR